ncbi:MAG: hypothetical protein EPO51_10985 [Phenylobacterium sp.]|uniref:hypothetical protein n=1 Tax=Phenylobacterium sp. TaxID=1871053 RepID=UPI0011F53512|nr:hypothetical protein [Phenylobacterium sp.]TAJ71652.1 MAG: hypothetical protein EPO51_10985 [Phenylobacterium sp.]
MRSLIQNRDVKTLFGGVAVAAVAGLLMGSAMYPDLDEDEIGGPQIQAAGGGPRSEVAQSGGSVAAYGPRVPDYVIGTDALKPPQYLALAYEERAEPEAAASEATDVMAYEAPEARPVSWQEEPRGPTSYPSEHGNVVHASDLPAPPAPPADGEDYPAGD